MMAAYALEEKDPGLCRNEQGEGELLADSGTG